jgi:hypothetical protein
MGREGIFTFAASCLGQQSTSIFLSMRSAFSLLEKIKSDPRTWAFISLHSWGYFPRFGG